MQGIENCSLSLTKPDAVNTGLALPAIALLLIYADRPIVCLFTAQHIYTSFGYIKMLNTTFTPDLTGIGDRSVTQNK